MTEFQSLGQETIKEIKIMKGCEKRKFLYN